MDRGKQPAGDASVEMAPGSEGSIGAFMARTTALSNAIMLTPASFTGKADLYDLGCLRMWRITCEGPMSVDGRTVSDTSWESGGEVHVLVQHSGALDIHRLDRASIALRSGDWCMMSKLGRFWARSNEPMAFTLLAIPGEELRSVTDPLPRLTDRVIPARSGPARLFTRFLAALSDEVADLSGPSRTSYGHALIQVLLSAVVDLANARENGPGGRQTYQRICEIIGKNLSRKELTVGFIAARLHCTPRHVHAVFAAHGPGTTTARYIRSQRLARCRAELELGRGSGRSIAELAHRWCFDDPSYFARAFKREYGVSPGAWLRSAP